MRLPCNKYNQENWIVAMWQHGSIVYLIAAVRMPEKFWQNLSMKKMKRNIYLIPLRTSTNICRNL